MEGNDLNVNSSLSYILTPVGNGSTYLNKIQLRTNKLSIIIGRNILTGLLAYKNLLLDENIQYISRKHAEIFWNDNEIFLRPLHGDKVLFLNGKACGSEQKLNRDDIICLLGPKDCFSYRLDVDTNEDCGVNGTPSASGDENCIGIGNNTQFTDSSDETTKLSQSTDNVKSKDKIDVIDLQTASDQSKELVTHLSEIATIIHLDSEEGPQVQASRDSPIVIINIHEDIQEPHPISSSSSSVLNGSIVVPNPPSSDLLEGLRRQYECSICYEIMACTFSISPCGDSFCYTCLYEWSQKATKCPMCQVEFDNKQSIPNKLVDNSIRELLKSTATELKVWEERVQMGLEARKEHFKVQTIPEAHNVHPDRSPWMPLSHQFPTRLPTTTTTTTTSSFATATVTSNPPRHMFANPLPRLNHNYFPLTEHSDDLLEGVRMDADENHRLFSPPMYDLFQPRRGLSAPKRVRKRKQDLLDPIHRWMDLNDQSSSTSSSTTIQPPIEPFIDLTEAGTSSLARGRLMQSNPSPMLHRTLLSPPLPPSPPTARDGAAEDNVQLLLDSKAKPSLRRTLRDRMKALHETPRRIGEVDEHDDDGIAPRNDFMTPSMRRMETIHHPMHPIHSVHHREGLHTAPPPVQFMTNKIPFKTVGGVVYLRKLNEFRNLNSSSSSAANGSIHTAKPPVECNHCKQRFVDENQCVIIGTYHASSQSEYEMINRFQKLEWMQFCRMWFHPQCIKRINDDRITLGQTKYLLFMNIMFIGDLKLEQQVELANGIS